MKRKTRIGALTLADSTAIVRAVDDYVAAHGSTTLDAMKKLYPDMAPKRYYPLRHRVREAAGIEGPVNGADVASVQEFPLMAIPEKPVKTIKAKPGPKPVVLHREDNPRELMAQWLEATARLLRG